MIQQSLKSNNEDSSKKSNTSLKRKSSPSESIQITEIFHKSILTNKIALSILEVGSNIKENLEKKIIMTIEGYCIREGYIKPKSVQVIQYSSGTVNGDNIEFCVVFECMVCHPIEGMRLPCTVKTITKAGIHAEVLLEDNIMPLIIFIARDHHNINKYFNELEEGDQIITKVIGIRYELNDRHICAIGEVQDESTSLNEGGKSLNNKKIRR